MHFYIANTLQMIVLVTRGPREYGLPWWIKYARIRVNSDFLKRQVGRKSEENAPFCVILWEGACCVVINLMPQIAQTLFFWICRPIACRNAHESTRCNVCERTALNLPPTTYGLTSGPPYVDDSKSVTNLRQKCR